MSKRQTRQGEETGPSARLSTVSISGLASPEGITGWLGTFRIRLAAARTQERRELQVTVAQLDRGVTADSKFRFRLDDSALPVEPPPGSLQRSAPERKNQ